MFITHRKHDAVLTVCQDNARKSVTVLTVNVAAEQLLGFAPEEVVGSSLNRFLPERISQDLEEYVEYEDGWNDVGNVLRRIRDFALVGKQGGNVPLQLRVIRAEPYQGHPVYQLIMREASRDVGNEAFRTILKENFKGHEVLDPDLKLPDRGSILKDIELVRYHVGRETVGASFAIVEVDDYRGLVDKEGQEQAHACMRAIGALCKQKLRGDDTVGCLSKSQLTLVLMDITQESARIVLNRLRWLIAAHPFTLENGKTISVNVSIGFGAIKSDQDENELLANCERSLEQARGQGGNLIVEAD